MFLLPLRHVLLQRRQWLWGRGTWRTSSSAKETLGYFHNIQKSGSGTCLKWLKAGGTVTWHLARCGGSHRLLSSRGYQFTSGKQWRNWKSSNQQHETHFSPAIMCSWEMFSMSELLAEVQTWCRTPENTFREVWDSVPFFSLFLWRWVYLYGVICVQLNNNF